VKSLYFYKEGSVRIPLTPVRLFVSGEGFSTVRIGGPVFEIGLRYGVVTLELVFLTLTAGWNAERYPT
jgi:hypothetical protein